MRVPTAEPGPAVPRHRARPRPGAPGLHRAAALLASLALAGATAALLAATVLPRVLGYRSLTMLTGSMAPGIRAGSVVIDGHEPAARLSVGQVVTYAVPVADHHVETHRVSWVVHLADGTAVFRTRGDANAADDPWTAHTTGSTVWVVRAVVPHLGALITTLRRPWAQLALSRALPLAVLGWLLVHIWCSPSRPPAAPGTGRP